MQVVLSLAMKASMNADCEHVGSEHEHKPLAIGS
jgi:hypothetical protein